MNSHRKPTVFFAFIWISVLFSSCSSPEDAYKQAIEQLGFIAFANPLAQASVGTILRGTAKENFLAASSADCFSNDTWFDNPTDLPTEDRSVSFGFTADANAVLSSGNSTVTLNANATFVKSVQLSFGDAYVEQLDEFKFGNFYRNQMSEQCKELLDLYPFINQAIKVSTMQFVFKDEQGGSIQLTADMIGGILVIKPGVTWSIDNDYTLTITTPKYIGYQLAEMAPGDRSGIISKYAGNVDSTGNWNFLLFSALPPQNQLLRY
jgi:hypothetical protein